MESARSAMAGMSNQQLIAQHKEKIKRMISELKSGLRESVFKQQTVVNKNVTLALRTLSGLSVTQFRAQKRLLNQACNIAFASEGPERTEEEEIRYDWKLMLRIINFISIVKQLSAAENLSQPHVCMSLN